MTDQPLTENALLHAIRLKLSRGDTRLFRNNVGAYEDRTGRWVQYGLGIGTSDLIGWSRRLILPVDVGCEWPVFTALECKSKHGKLSPDQIAFLGLVKAVGGIAGCVRSVADAENLLLRK